MGKPDSWAVKAVVFDLDGTLVDSAPDLQAALNRLLAEEGRRPLALEDVTGMVGDGAARFVERGFAATGAAVTGPALDALVQRFLIDYEANACVATRPFPGVVEALARLKACGLALGVCTNKPAAATREVLAGVGLASYFDCVVGGDSVPGARKPDPRPVWAVLEGLGVPPAQAVVVGDSANDVAAAHAAGLPAIVVATGYTRVPPETLGAELVIDGFAQLPAAFADIRPRVS